MKDEAKTENVTNRLVLSLHILKINNFRSDIAWCSTSHEQIFLRICELSKAIVTDHAIKLAL
jgi:hypothetical protein